MTRASRGKHLGRTNRRAAEVVPRVRRTAPFESAAREDRPADRAPGSARELERTFVSGRRAHPRPAPALAAREFAHPVLERVVEFAAEAGVEFPAKLPALAGLGSSSFRTFRRARATGENRREQSRRERRGRDPSETFRDSSAVHAGTAQSARSRSVDSGRSDRRKYSSTAFNRVRCESLSAFQRASSSARSCFSSLLSPSMNASRRAVRSFT